MDGATAIDLSMLKSKRMLNIDSEEEGVLLTSCAGGMRTECHIPVSTEYKEGGVTLKVTVGGLLGGHSGTEINKGRVNAIKLLSITLKRVLDNVSFKLVEISGGEKDNAIPRQAEAVVYVDSTDRELFLSEIGKFEKIEINENSSREKGLFIKAFDVEMGEAVSFDADSTLKVLDFLTLLPNGVIQMSADIVGLPETSLNVGVLKTEKNEVVSTSALRSSVDSAKQLLNLQVETLAKTFGGHIESHGEYPGWQFNPNSKLRADMVRIYKEMFGVEAKVEALHAGLECGIMISKIPGLDCVSFGPNILDIHTTEEKLSISSTERTWRYILEILRQ
jgi:dipeptidase D